MYLTVDLPFTLIVALLAFWLGNWSAAKSNYEYGKVEGFLEGQVALLKEINDKKGLPESGTD